METSKWPFVVIGRPETPKGHPLSSIPYIPEIIPFYILPAYENAIVLRQNYLENGLTVKQMSVLHGCSSTTIKKKLHHFRIRKTPHQAVPHKANLRYGQKLISGKVQNHKKESRITKVIANMYIDEGLSVTAIARLLTQMNISTKKRGKGWDHSIIIAILKRENIYTPKRQSKGKK